MKQRWNGFQCEKCQAIYATQTQAENCERQPIEQPLLKIGDILMDDSYDVENEIRVCKIYFNEHQVCYRMEWQNPEKNGSWEELYTIYGNAMLQERYDI